MKNTPEQQKHDTGGEDTKPERIGSGVAKSINAELNQHHNCEEHQRVGAWNQSHAALFVT